jgi:hypothetical protein
VGGLSLVFAARALSQELPPSEVPNARVSPVLNPIPGDPIMAFRIGYAGTFDSQIADGEIGNSIVGGLSRQMSFRRGSFNIAGNGSQYFYSNAPEASRFTFDVGASGSYQISRRATFVVSERVSSGFAREASSITEAQLAFPNAIVTSNGLSVGYGYELSRKTRFQVAAQYDNLLFDSSQPNVPPTNVNESLLNGGGTFSFRTSLSHLMSHSDSIGIAQEFASSTTGADRATTNSLHATWQRPLSSKYSLSAEGGISAFVTETLSGVNVAPTGSVSVSRKVSRQATFGVRASQSIEVLGDTHVSTSINLDGSTKIGSRLSVGVVASTVHNHFPADPSFDYNPLIVGGNLGYALPGNLVIAGSYSYWRRYSAALPTSTTYNGSLSLSYGRSWH